ncbi:MAG: F0F1 ATP synthase subunit A, partial [Dehalococcoidia bacterium]
MRNPRTWIFIVVIVALFILAQRVPLFKVALPVVQLPAENLHIFGLSIPNTMLATWIGMLIIVGLSYMAVKNMELVPEGVQNLIEWTIEAFYGLVESVVGEDAPRFFPLAMTIFLLVLVVNWMELIPGMDSIGLLERVHEGQPGYEVTHAGPIGLLRGTEAEQEGFVVVPFVRTASTDLNLTFALALISVITCQYVGLKAQGLGYVQKFF